MIEVNYEDYFSLEIFFYSSNMINSIFKKMIFQEDNEILVGINCG